jgi:hypothetical protein
MVSPYTYLILKGLVLRTDSRWFRPADRQSSRMCGARIPVPRHDAASVPRGQPPSPAAPVNLQDRPEVHCDGQVLIAGG